MSEKKGVIYTIPLSAHGLLTVAEAAAQKGRGVRAVQRWIQDGHLVPVAVSVGGGRVLYLLPAVAVAAFTPRAPGAPAGNKFAEKKSAQKPRKTRSSRDSGKESRRC